MFWLQGCLLACEIILYVVSIALIDPVGSQDKLIANDFGEAGLGVEQEFVV